MPTEDLIARLRDTTALSDPLLTHEAAEALEALGREVAELKELADSEESRAVQYHREKRELKAEVETLKGYRDRALELATAYNNSQENIEQICAHRDHILKVNDTLRAELAELKNDAFSYKVAWETVCDGAKDVVSDLEKARTELDTLRAELAAISATDKDAGLVAALKDAATSLETISRLAGRTHYVGDDGERVETYMGHHDQVRGYATSRASVARNALSKIGCV